jgi:hypothetical protein
MVKSFLYLHATQYDASARVSFPRKTIVSDAIERRGYLGNAYYGSRDEPDTESATVMLKDVSCICAKHL